MKILILGNGFVGTNLHEHLSCFFDCYISNRKELDVTNADQAKNFFNTKQFTHIVYACGNKNVTDCSLKIPEAFSLNSLSINNLKKTLTNKIKFIYISSDYVYEGCKPFYDEMSPTFPQTIYGASKLAGENITRCLFENHVIIRTGGLFGKNCSWLNSLLNYDESKGAFKCYGDIYNTPTYIKDLSVAIKKIIDFNFIGLCNIAGNKRYNRYTLYKDILKYSGKDSSFLLNSSCDTFFPKDLSLNNSFSINTLDFKMTCLKQAISELI